MGKRFMLVTEEGNYLFVHKVEPENTQKKKSHTANSKLFVKTFLHVRCKIFEGK